MKVSMKGDIETSLGRVVVGFNLFGLIFFGGAQGDGVCLFLEGTGGRGGREGSGGHLPCEIET